MSTDETVASPNFNQFGKQSLSPSNSLRQLIMRRSMAFGAAGATLLAVGMISISVGVRHGGVEPHAPLAKVLEPILVTAMIAPNAGSGAPELGSLAPLPTPSSHLESASTIAAGTARCATPGALGVSRVVEIDTTGGPGFGFEHFKQLDFLRDKEVVLTFDDGPWPTTNSVLKALADECVQATFFAIGKHATYYPDILRSIAKAGHTVGSHTWSHQDLTKKTPGEAKAEIEKAISAVQHALGDEAQEASFFRFPALRHPPEMVTYLGERNIAIFSTDIDSLDFKLRKPEQVIKSVLAKLEKHGKGIVLMHDFQHATAEAMPQLLAELKAGGYKIVHLRSRAPALTLRDYDEDLQKGVTLHTVSQSPTSTVVRDVR